MILLYSGLDLKKPPAQLIRRKLRKTCDTPGKFIFHHAIAAQHEGVSLYIRKGVKIGPNRCETLLNIFAHSVVRPGAASFSGIRFVEGRIWFGTIDPIDRLF